ISDLWHRVNLQWIPTPGHIVTPQADLVTPQIDLHCPSDKCGGEVRVFRYLGTPLKLDPAHLEPFLTYRCSNCMSSEKLFAIRVECKEMTKMAGSGEGYKLGEEPPYGPPTPSRLLRLFESEKDNFLKGRRSESQGLGIGAFGYYRRVVE